MTFFTLKLTKRLQVPTTKRNELFLEVRNLLELLVGGARFELATSTV